MDTSELFMDEDLDSPAGGSETRPPAAAKQQASELLQSMEGLSARERNKLKRKAKALGRAESLTDGAQVQFVCGRWDTGRGGSYCRVGV